MGDNVPPEMVQKRAKIIEDCRGASVDARQTELLETSLPLGVGFHHAGLGHQACIRFRAASGPY